MIRTVRRLGDAASNITATVGPAEGLSAPVQNYIQASLTAQGVNPATATPAQIQSAYNSFASQQTFQNLAPVYGQPSAPAQIASAAIAAASAPQLPVATLQLPAPAPILAQPSASTASYNHTADIEMIVNTLAQYGDTWDSPTSLQARLYAQGIIPGTVTQAQVLNVANLAASTTTPPATSFTFSSLPWYAWAGAAGIGLVLFGRKGR